MTCIPIATGRITDDGYCKCKQPKPNLNGICRKCGKRIKPTYNITNDEQ